MPEIKTNNEAYYLEMPSGERVEFPTYDELIDYLNELKNSKPQAKE